MKTSSLIRPLGALLILVGCASCVAPHPSPVEQGRRRGGATDLAMGGPVNGWEGAAAGAFVGGAVGGLSGRASMSHYTGTSYWAPPRKPRELGYYGGTTRLIGNPYWAPPRRPWETGF